MPIPVDSTRVTLTGSAPGGEIFQWGFWTINTVGSPAAATTMATQIRDLWNTTAVNTALRFLITSDCAYTAVKVYCYPTGGPTADFVGQAAITSAGTGIGTGTSSAPLYQCMVVSTNTGLAGRSHRGRLYLPATGTLLDSAHRFSIGATSGAATSMKALMDGVNSIGTPVDFRVAVVSQFLGTMTPITDIEVDSKPDVQRRRENRMAPGVTSPATIAA